MGHAMTDTQRLTGQQWPAGSDNLFVAWETLTHAGNRRRAGDPRGRASGRQHVRSFRYARTYPFVKEL
ncbi:hypothetical protein GCM10010271_37590 [Streptomyces kurssanovii]|nr:hypothetical protein GCM10010271_37590 [Streptomyces kurssanovii]